MPVGGGGGRDPADGGRDRAVESGFLRYALGGACLAALVQLIRPGALRLPREELPKIALLGVLMYALFPFLFNTSLRYTTASRGAVILALSTVFTAVLGRVCPQRAAQDGAVGRGGLFDRGGGDGFRGEWARISDGRSAVAGNALMVGAALVGAVYSVAAGRS